MTDQRGVSLVDLLVAGALSAIVAGALLSAYVATTRSFGESSAQAALQRQGTLVLEEIGHQVRGAVEPSCDGNPDCLAVAALTIDTCNGHADALRVKTATGDVCYYAREDGALCEYRGIACRNLLAGGLRRIELWRQPSGPDPRCPPGADDLPRPAGALCFRMTVPTLLGLSSTQVNLAFAIRDSDGDLDGVNVMAFGVSLTCSGRNCV